MFDMFVLKIVKSFYKVKGENDMNKRFIHICVMCGKDYESNARGSYKCPKCESKLALVKKLEIVDKAEYKLTRTSGRQRMKNGIDLSKEICTVKKRVANGIDRFSSLQEAMVAIQLEKQNVKYESQKEINGKKVDFFLPELKIILEIDGELYHTDEDKEFLRDRQIMRGIGEEYEIVHIEADSVPRYTWNLKEALVYIVQERNEQWRFRDSLFDTYFLVEFRNMELYLRRRSEYDNKGVFISNQQIRQNGKK